MSVTIQDDMWRSAEAMQGKQGEAFLLALIRYGFTGEEPKPGSKVYPFFVLCRDRIAKSAEKMSKGKRMAEARWGKHDAQAPDKHDAQSQTSMMHKHDAQTPAKHRTENESESENESENEKEKEKEELEESPQASMRNANVAEVISHLNEVCGTSYKPDSETSRKYVGARLDEGFTVADCKRVIDNMAQAWRGDSEMRQYLRPTTLFRKEKFEGYLNRVAEVSRYAEYD